ncbi:hypothetical protein D0Q02_22205 [Micromonospora craniellae]|uniref:Uncharacterized protein n=1 Tax=Micromonospora craniellae TaxID=2294034 RepID=A0A372FV13_9ACTN|nr:hypothetical protein D0Q02_22205 [Micromonospora craniellae]
MDIQVWNPDGYDFYQVKRYPRPLTARQATKIQESWETFVRETVPLLPVRSWTLVTPWNPSNPRLDWLRELTAGQGFPTHWMGGRTLDAMAADRPSLVDYFFGDGGERLQRLMASALQGGRDIAPGVVGEDLLDAILARHRGLADALNDVDPFYRYELDIRTGGLGDLPWDIDIRPGSPVAMVQYRQLDAERYQVMRILPRHPGVMHLRPITGTLRLEVNTGSPEHLALEEFSRFGAPFQDIPGTVIEMSGPSGLARRTGAGLFTFLAAPNSGNGIPDLDVRLVSTDGRVLHTLELVEVEAARGADGGPGTWICGRDRSGALQFRFFLHGPDGHEIRILTGPLTGKTPAEALPAVRMAAELVDGNELLLAVRGGRPITCGWAVSDSAVRANARWHVSLLEALAAIQRFTWERVTIPDVDALSDGHIEEILRTGRLLQGERIETTWTQVTLTVASRERLPTPGVEAALIAETPIIARVGDREIPLDAKRRVIYRTARIADPAEVTSAQAGDTIRLLPGSTDHALILAIPTEHEQ